MPLDDYELAVPERFPVQIRVGGYLWGIFDALQFYVEADIQNLPFGDEELEGVLCLYVLEHVENPFKATSELFRVLKTGGKMFVSVPFIWPYHAAKQYKDFWRFSEDSLRFLFKDFSSVEIVPVGGYFRMLVNLLPDFSR